MPFLDMWLPCSKTDLPGPGMRVGHTATYDPSGTFLRLHLGLSTIIRSGRCGRGKRVAFEKVKGNHSVVNST